MLTVTYCTPTSRLYPESTYLHEGVYTQPQVIGDDLDPDVYRIAPKMWICYLVGIRHFAECRENQLVTV